MPFPWFGKRKEKPPAASPAREDFQEQMLRYAEQQLVSWLSSHVGSDWASRVSSYVIEPGRVCAEALPYRIYVYNLGDFLGKLGYEALERRRDAPGSVFEHKESNLNGKTVGVFMYQVEGFPMEPPSRQQKQAQHEQRPEDTFDNPENLKFTTVRLEGDPEQVAEDLIRDSLPNTLLDEIDISDQAGLGKLFACLLQRRNQASLEKDEIVRFVERNRKPLKSGALDLLQKLAEAGTHVEGGESLGRFFQYFSKAVSSALEGRPQDIDVKSDRLLWLIYALAQQLSEGHIDYIHATAILLKPQHRDRISRLSLVFMLRDFAESLSTASQAPVEYILLILECALISNDVSAAAAASAILSKLPAPRDPSSFINIMERAREALASAGRKTFEIDECLKRYKGSSRPKVADDDL